MANEQQTVQQQPMEVESVSELNIRDLISACFDKWYWFAISIVFCMSIAALYILMTQKSYTREAMIMIKSNSKGASAIDYGMDDFSNLGLFNTKSGVNDELIAIQSPSIISEVVKRLNIDYSYQKEGTFRNEVLYGATNPVKAEIVDVADLFGCSFKMTIEPNGSFKLTKFRYAVDNKPVDLMFMLLSPESNGADHLTALALISRILKNNSMAEKIRNASGKDEIYALLNN